MNFNLYVDYFKNIVDGFLSQHDKNIVSVSCGGKFFVDSFCRIMPLSILK